MISILKEIKKIRNCDDYDIDFENSNRYCLIVNEKNEGKTAYCFNTPIYGLWNKKMIKPKFEHTSNGYIHNGTNSSIRIIGNIVYMSSVHGDAKLIFDEETFGLKNDGKLTGNNITIIPILNGIKITCKCEETFEFKLMKDGAGYEKRYNSKYFAFMIDQAKPFLSISGLYAKGKKGDVQPVEITYEEKEDVFSFSLMSNKCKEIHIEVNMYEEKMIHDTTVETAHPDENNAYGSIAFIGKSNILGEQWLYARPNFEKIPELCHRRILSVKLFIPQYNEEKGGMNIYVPERRFCSFGSTWNNKIPIFEKIGKTEKIDNYQVAEITKAVVDGQSHKLLNKTGMVFKAENKIFAIATADNYYTPQIMEIKYL